MKHFILIIFIVFFSKIEAQVIQYGGTYSYGTHPDSGRTGLLHIYPISENTFLFHLDLSRGAPSYNMGELVGKITISSSGEGNYTVKADSDYINCSFTLQFRNDSVFIRTNNDAVDCGYGFGVYSDGDFKKITNDIPKFFIDQSGKKRYFKNLDWKDWRR